MNQDDLERHRNAWTHRGTQRPDFAQTPGPGQESVWDYPRPPAIVPDTREVIVSLGGTRIARTTSALRVLETASPPTFYIPRAHVEAAFLTKATGNSFCEWKGSATYWDARCDNAHQRHIAWSYEAPFPAFSRLAGYLAFYPARATCLVDGETVRPQAGGFYGGWITGDIVGPFKGQSGTGGW